MDTTSVRYHLNPVVADAVGQGTSLTSMTDLPGGIPVGALTIHNGPGTSSSHLPWRDQALPLTCGTVARQDHPTSESVTLGGTPAVDERISGTAKMTEDHDSLTVTLTVAHLQPNSQHVAHIHQGSCSNQGPIVADLDTLRANADGHATSTTHIAGVSTVPHSGWYVNVHLAPTMADLATQTGFTPIACGDVTMTPATQ